MTIRLLAVDLDGTITPDGTTIPARTRAAIKTAQAAGVVVTIATGREYKITTHFAALLELAAPLICYQGGMIQEYPAGDIWFTHAADLDLSRQVVKFARAQQLHLLLYTPHHIYTELPSAQMAASMAHYGARVSRVHNLLSAVRPEEPPLKFLCLQTEKDTPRVYRLLHNAFGQTMNVVTSHTTMVEICPREATKGEALAYLAGRLNIPLSEVMAIGDQDNDVSMLSIAGISVAMGNASPAARQAAKFTAPTISEEGAAWAIETYILGEKGG